MQVYWIDFSVLKVCQHDKEVFELLFLWYNYLMKNKKRKIIKLFTYLLIAFAFGFILSTYFNDQELLVQEQTFVEESEMISAIEEVSPAVVSIITKKNVPYFYEFSYESSYIAEYENEEISGGTGFLVSHDGLVFTNHHVIQDEEAQYTIIFNDGSEYLAKIISIDPLEDVAILKIISDEEELYFENIVEFGDSSNLKVGQRVLAIGNALTIYGNTVTSGIISAIDRKISAYNDFTRREKNFFGLIQTDAAINFGNSGGPLINLNGEVIGMSVAVANMANNIGFAIPSEVLIPIVESVKEHGRIVRPFLGVRFVMLTSEQAQELGLDEDYGAILLSGSFLSEPAIYPNGPADEADLRDKDIILEVDGQKLDAKNYLNEIIRNYKSGDSVVLKVWRAGDSMEVTVVLGDSSDYIE